MHDSLNQEDIFNFLLRDASLLLSIHKTFPSHPDFFPGKRHCALRTIFALDKSATSFSFSTIASVMAFFESHKCQALKDKKKIPFPLILKLSSLTSIGDDFTELKYLLIFSSWSVVEGKKK